MNIFIEGKEVPKNAKIIDTRFQLQNPEAGKEMYKEGHIEGAIYFDLNEDLSDLSLNAGRHPMPSDEKLQQLFERSGLELDDFIVVYDQGGAPYSARAWFLLYYAGFKHVKIVNGGMQALVDAGFKLTTETPTIAPTKLKLTFKHAIVANKEDVKHVTLNRTSTLVDARSYERYIGDVEPIDPVKGHIPTAQNYDWEKLFHSNYFGLEEDFSKQFPKENNYIVYCGSGVSAAPLYVAFKEQGFEHVKLYVGSFSDWITTEEVATGDETNQK